MIPSPMICLTVDVRSNDIIIYKNMNPRLNKQYRFPFLLPGKIINVAVFVAYTAAD